MGRHCLGLYLKYGIFYVRILERITLSVESESKQRPLYVLNMLVYRFLHIYSKPNHLPFSGL